MCLAVPGKIIEIDTSSGIRMCKVDFGGVFQKACLDALPEANIGDYIIVHAGYGLSVLDEAEALETLKLFAQINTIGVTPKV